MQLRAGIFLMLCLTPLVSRAADSSPHDLLNSLNALGLDVQNVYTVSAKDRIELHHADAVLSFEEGKIAFYQPFQGRVTGFVFSGIGHVLALPRDSVEKQQMARLTGAPILDQQFFSAYVRFTDDTAQDLLAEFHRADVHPAPDVSFGELWQANLGRLNSSHSLRILYENFSRAPRHFFHAGLDGAVSGPFDILVDPLHLENFLIGQPRTASQNTYYNVWASYSLPDSIRPSPQFAALRYHIDTTIHPDNSLDADTSVEFRALSGTEQAFFVQISRSLKMDGITLDSGDAVPFFQNEGLTQQQLRTLGDDSVCLFLPKPPQKGETFKLHFRYHGNVIENAGNAVLFVGARGSWYPHFGDSAEFAFYDLVLHWPKRLRLVATGNKGEEREDGDFHVAEWTTDQPISQAGFNLGEYTVYSVNSENRSVDVYANKQLEDAILARLASTAPPLPPPITHPQLNGPNITFEPSTLAPSPTDALKQLAHNIDSSIHFYEKFSGPFPFHRLGVSQIPGNFGQGWPGLLYLSTFSFLSTTAQRQAGLTTTGQELFTDIIPYHEVAHQWWGNIVVWSSYRDQWIDESIAAYLALLFADSQKNSDQTLRLWLDRYRKQLITKTPQDDVAPGDVGPLIMGTRLSSSKSPDAYNQLVYAKGPWVFHMLHEMLRDPKAKDPDARFTTLLQTLIAKYSRAALTTADLQTEVESVMTPKMDLEGGHSMEWFFAEYVRGTGIPHYKVDFTSKRTEKGFLVRGRIHQTHVPHSFLAPVPIYASAGPGHSILLGTVVAAGEETSFSFTTSSEPHKLLIDPHMTLLCVPE
jgi:Peptidase family M1 domain